MPLPLLLLAAAITLQSPGPYSSDEGRFSVRLPEKASTQTVKVPSAVGELELHILQIDRGSVAYLVMYNDYPNVADDSDALLEAVIRGGVDRIDGKVVSKRDVKLGPVPGKEYEAEFVRDGTPGVVHARVYIDRARLYQVIVSGTRKLVHSREAVDFMDSFRITGGKNLSK